MRFRSIDALRGLAALLVVLYHSGFDFVLGAIGVDIFFVISGFVMAKVSEGRTAGDFLADRAWRIYPPYLLLVGPIILFAFASGVIGMAKTTGSLLLWPRWFGIPANYYAVSWTLVFELAFYVAVAASIKLKSAALPLALFGLALVMRPFTDNPLINFVGNPIAVEFLFGVAIARVPSIPSYGKALGLVAIVWLKAAPIGDLHAYWLAYSYWHSFLRVVIWGIPSAMLVYAALSHEQEWRWPKWALTLGAASYSIYLVHPHFALPLKLAWPVEAALSVAVGLVAWKVVERPILQWRRGEGNRGVARGLR